jgi:glutathione S-transferase
MIFLSPSDAHFSTLEGGMILYLKAGPDETSVGDCPFAHCVRLVLEEKGLEYDLKPRTVETKPSWLVEHYEGKLPALQHRKECYVESGVIAEYLDFFFPAPSLKPPKGTAQEAEEALDGFFPTVAKYLKQVNNEEEETLQNLQAALDRLESHLLSLGKDYLCGDSITLLDCSLIPKLYHLKVGVDGFKEGKPSLADYPQVSAYYKRATERPSFQSTVYPEETILWGWGNARK